MKSREEINQDILEIVETENIPALKELIENNVDLYVERDSGYFGIKRKEHVVQIAAFTNKPKVLQCILDSKKLDINFTSDSGHNLAQLAIEGKSLETLIFLIDNGINVNSSTRTKITLLHAAAHKGFTKGVELLIEKHANINAKNEDGATPLHYAAQEGRVDVIKCLGSYSAILDIKDGNGDTPIHYAVNNGMLPSVECLINLGANVNLQDNDGKTALHMAGNLGNTDIVECLIKHSADTEIEDKDEKTPLDLAVDNDNPEIVRVLIEHGAIINDYELSGDFEDVADYYLTLGKLLQHFCYSNKYLPFNSEILTKAIEDEIFSKEDLVKFSTLTIENFALKVGTTRARLDRNEDGKSMRDKDGFVIDKDGNKVHDFNYKNLQELVECGTCVEKIKNHPDLPDFIKMPILELMRTLIFNAQESMEDLDSVLLYLQLILPSPIPYSTTVELIANELFAEKEVKEITNFYKEAPRFKVPGNLTIELVCQQMSDDLTRLAAYMFINDDFKENVESLLKMAIPVKLREVLTDVLIEFNNHMKSPADYIRILEKIEFLPAHNGIPDAAIRQKNQAMQEQATHEQFIQDCKIMMSGEDAAKDTAVEHP